MTQTSSPPITVAKRGEVDEADVEYALKRVGAVVKHVGAPILFARVRLSREAGSKEVRPAIAQTTLDINGKLLRAQVAAATMTEAIDQLADRLRDQIQHRAERLRARRFSLQRRGGLRSARALFAQRPVEEREIVRHKTFATMPATPDEAADDMDMLDYDFWLFHDLASDADAVLERLDDGRYRLQRARPVDHEAGPLAIEVEVVDQPPPTGTVDDARALLEAGGLPFVFFVNAETGRGNVLYQRYDGNYGLLSPA